MDAVIIKKPSKPMLGAGIPPEALAGAAEAGAEGF